MGLCKAFTIVRILTDGIPPMADPSLFIKDVHFEDVRARVYKAKRISPEKRKGIVFFPGGTGTAGSIGKQKKHHFTTGILKGDMMAWKYIPLILVYAKLHSCSVSHILQDFNTNLAAEDDIWLGMATSRWDLRDPLGSQFMSRLQSSVPLVEMDVSAPWLRYRRERNRFHYAKQMIDGIEGFNLPCTEFQLLAWCCTRPNPEWVSAGWRDGKLFSEFSHCIISHSLVLRGQKAMKTEGCDTLVEIRFTVCQSLGAAMDCLPGTHLHGHIWCTA